MAEEQNAEQRQKLLQLCRGNAAAAHFLLLWRAYVHAIDDIIDGDMKEREEIIRSFILAQEIYTHGFFIQHGPELKRLVRLVTNAYADSVAWEQDEKEWRRQIADTLRHAGNEMVLAVVDLCAEAQVPGTGYDAMRSVSLQLRALNYWEHHTPDGRPV
jgi:hypothetical protein